MIRESLYREAAAKQSGQVSTFEDLEVYTVAREFRMYGVANNLPETEKFGPASQIRRAAVSLTNNIAEGHGRYRYLDQIKFTLQPRGSLEELIDDLNTCEHEQYLPPEQMTALKKQGWRVWQLIEATSVICGNRLRLPVPELKMRNAGTYMPGLQIFSV